MVLTRSSCESGFLCKAVRRRVGQITTPALPTTDKKIRYPAIVPSRQSDNTCSSPSPEKGVRGLKELRVVLADDSLLVQEYIKRAIPRIRGCNLVGIAGDGEEALLMIQILHPDVVLLDVTMPLKNGVEVLRELRKENSSVKVIMFTADTTPCLKEKCLAEGANYFVSKTEFRQLVDIFVDLQTR
jgi:two-component system, chemotaxis family, chemotaxis protein CheY